MMEYLDERFPHPPLLPVYPVARANCRELMLRIDREWCPLVDSIISEKLTKPKEKNTMDIVIPLAIFVAGFIVGALVTRKNLDEVNVVVREAKELAASVDSKLDEIRDANKKPARKETPTKKSVKK